MIKRRGGIHCAFKNCKNVGGKTTNISFFRFPKDAQRSILWVNACKRKDLKNKTCEDLYKNYRVCQLHFENYMFLNDLKNRLQSHAYPKPMSSTAEILKTNNLNLSETELLIQQSTNPQAQYHSSQDKLILVIGDNTTPVDTTTNSYQNFILENLNITAVHLDNLNNIYREAFPNTVVINNMNSTISVETQTD